MFTGMRKETLVSYLLSKGFTVGSNKLSDYTTSGVVTQGIRRIGQQVVSPLYYSPITIIEFMTASLLKRGNRLKIKKKQEYTKLTLIDIYTGRRAFLADMLNSEELTDRYLFFDKENHNDVTSDVLILSCLDEIPRQIYSIYENKMYEEPYQCYMRWAYWEYKPTFDYLFDTYINEILKLPMETIPVREGIRS